MLDALDHLTLRASFVAGAVGAYETLLGRSVQDGRFQLGNVGIVIEDDSSTAHLSRMTFVTKSLDDTARRLERRAIKSERADGRLLLANDATHGVPIALIEKVEKRPPSPLAKTSEAASIASLDHVVIRTPAPERAVALYGGRLGLDLRLDRSNPDWGSRLLFFRCGDLVVEIVHDLKKGVSDAPDRLWGLSWRTPDVAACHARLQKAGVELSEVRKGRRPGSEVFTVLSHTANIPTLVIGGVGRW